MPCPAPSSARVGPLALAGLLWLVGCPAPAPTPISTRKTPEASEPASPSAADTPTAEAEPASPEPAPPEPLDPSLPPVLTKASPMARQLWAALDATDDGDVAVLSSAMAPTARWFPPGSVQESISSDGDELGRAMASWSGPAIELDVRRVIELGGPVVAQVAIRDTTNPTARYEVALVVEDRDGQIGMVRHYGDPLGPVRRRPEDSGRTLDLGPATPLTLVGGAAEPTRAKVVEAMQRAAETRNGAVLEATLADDVVLHDIKGRRTHRGPSAYAAAIQGDLGDEGHLTVLKDYAAADLVVVEGAIYGVAAAEDGSAREHGVLDIHRVEGDVIVESWRYLNRRGRPHRRRAVETPAKP